MPYNWLPSSFNLSGIRYIQFHSILWNSAFSSYCASAELILSDMSDRWRMYTSPDGVNWTQRYSVGGVTSGQQLAIGNGIIVAIYGVAGVFRPVVSNNGGVSWTDGDPLQIAESESGLAVGMPWFNPIDSKFYVVVFRDFDNNAYLMSSSNGLSWDSQVVASDPEDWAVWEAIATTGVTRYRGTYYTCRGPIYTSSDLLSWTVLEDSGSSDSYGITISPNRIMFHGYPSDLRYRNLGAGAVLTATHNGDEFDRPPGPPGYVGVSLNAVTRDTRIQSLISDSNPHPVIYASETGVSWTLEPTQANIAEAAEADVGFLERLVVGPKVLWFGSCFTEGDALPSQFSPIMHLSDPEGIVGPVGPNPDYPDDPGTPEPPAEAKMFTNLDMNGHQIILGAKSDWVHSEAVSLMDLESDSVVIDALIEKLIGEGFLPN